MKALLRLLLRKLWPARAPAAAGPAVPPGAPDWHLGGGWVMEQYAVTVQAGVAAVARRLVCPTRRLAWPQDRRGFLTVWDRPALPN